MDRTAQNESEANFENRFAFFEKMTLTLVSFISAEIKKKQFRKEYNAKD